MEILTFIDVKKSQTLTLNEKAKDLQRLGKTVYKFGFGESPFSPMQSVQHSLANAIYRQEYTPVQGLPELRENIAAFHSEIDGYPIDAHQILVAPGTKPLLHNAIKAFHHANMFVPAPAWVSYAPQAILAGHDVHRIPSSFLDRWRVTPTKLDEMLRVNKVSNRPNLLALNYPGNPEGLTYTRSELQALTAVLREHDVWVISDEIYGLLHHEGHHVSLASIYPERTLVTTGLSKWCGAGGWRLGALILPPDAPQALNDALIGLASEVYSCASVPVQVAAMRAYSLEQETFDYLDYQRKILSRIGQSIYRHLADAGVAVHAPEGGFYLLLDFRPFAEQLSLHDIMTDEALCTALLEATGVMLLPGSAFGMAPEALTARLAYVDFEGDMALNSIASLEQDTEAFVGQFAGKMLDGIHLLINWLN